MIFPKFGEKAQLAREIKQLRNMIRVVRFVFAITIVVFGVTSGVLQAYAATTAVAQDVTSGSLSISNSGNQSLSSTSVSFTSQNTTGSLGTVTAVDTTGSGNGWTATATSTDFVKVNSAVMTSGSNNTVTTDGSSTYNSSTAGTYTITITTGGSVGVAQFSVSGLQSASNQTTGATAAIGTRGVTATFASATYVIGDAWTIRVDVIPVTDLQITPGSATGNNGSDTTNVTSGSQHTYTSTSDAETLITAPAGYGLGSYSVTPSLQLTIPANSYANTYTATVTETVS